MHFFIQKKLFFFCSIEEHIIPANTPLDMGEKTMKRLLLEWVDSFLNHEKLNSWVLASWASALKCLPTSIAVDFVPAPTWAQSTQVSFLDLAQELPAVIHLSQ
jgi:hypothetical protein